MTAPQQPTRAHRRTSARVRRRRRLVTTIAVVTVIVLGGGAALTFALTRGGETPPTVEATIPLTENTPSAEPAELTAAEQLLASSTDPNACAVTFAGEGIEIEPQLQTEGVLYTGLPIPKADGRVFAGWYDSEEDAAAYAIPGRINGAELTACTDRQITLHAAWKTPEENAAEDAGIPILMYHQFTRNPDGENNSLRLNYAWDGDFAAQMGYIKDSAFYLPTWDELSAFIDGELFLPKHSVIITDDDADSSWLELAAPIVHGDGLLTTSFVITNFRSEPAPNPYVLQRSHTHDMHSAGGNGKGKMVNWSAADIAADLETSAEILGAKEVIAYPFGHYNDTAKQGVADAGFELARTIEQGYVRIGTDKLALPCIRINYGMGVDELAALIG